VRAEVFSTEADTFCLECRREVDKAVQTYQLAAHCLNVSLCSGF